MRLQPNIGSDRSWVWKVAADYAESPPTSETLAIRFANSDSEFDQIRLDDSYADLYRIIDAAQFKTAFEEGQKTNIVLSGGTVPEEPKAAEEEDKPAEEAENKEEGAAEKEEDDKKEEA